MTDRQATWLIVLISIEVVLTGLLFWKVISLPDRGYIPIENQAIDPANP
jgi:hypothetical protein